MADISQIKLPNGDTFDLVDEKSGYIKSYTDEKVKQTPLNANQNSKGLLLGSTMGTSETTATAYISNKFLWNDYLHQLTIYGLSTSYCGIKPTEIWFSTGSYSATIKRPDSILADYIYTLPAKTGTIALTSDIPDTSSFLTSETDPVFSASAAAGISATDISNWNAKSDTDEKLKTTLVTQEGQTAYPIFGLTSTTIAENKLIDTNFKYLPQSTSVSLTLGSSGGKAGLLELYNGGGYIILHSSQVANGVKNIYLPAQNGTIALTSDIPQVYSSTNTGGYLTMATLPIYDGTVV